MQLDPSESDPQLKRMRLRYVGTCVRCGLALPKGADALYCHTTRTVRCVECSTVGAGGERSRIDGGVAGASAIREFVRRKAARESRVKGRLGNLVGGVVLALSGEPQSTRAWERGAFGEQQLAEALAEVIDLRALHDRRVPGTRGNIDHLLIAPAGVFVVDAKLYKGEIRIRDRGGLFRSDDRLYVGRRDCSHLAENMGSQVESVRRVLESADLEVMPPITPVLCFVDGEWPLLWPPESYRGVRLEGKRSIKKLITRDRVLDVEAIDRLARILAVGFPAR